MTAVQIAFFLQLQQRNLSSRVLILRPTLELATRLKLDPLCDLPLAGQPIADWCVRDFKCGRIAYLMFSNTVSLFSFVTPRRGVTNAKSLRTTFATAIHQNLDRVEHGQQHASGILAALTDCQFSRCYDRSVISSINDLMQMTKVHLEYGDTIAMITPRLNQTPMSLLNMDHPARRFAGLSVI